MAKGKNDAYETFLSLQLWKKCLQRTMFFYTFIVPYSCVWKFPLLETEGYFTNNR